MTPTEAMLAATVTTLAGAIVVLWRMQVNDRKRCEAERLQCEEEQKRLWASLVELTGKSINQLKTDSKIASPKNTGRGGDNHGVGHPATN